MPVCKIQDFISLIAKNSPLLGIDNGSKHIGLAISDPMWMLATPLQVVERAKFSAFKAVLEDLFKARKIGGIVVGLPLGLDGSTTPSAQSARTLAKNLADAFPDMPITFFDERFSSAVIQRELTERVDLTRAKRAAVVDKLAAGYILQGALDYIRIAADKAATAPDA